MRLATTARSGQDIPDDLAKAFWKLILEGTACITFLRRICVDRQSRLSDESSSESESLSTLSEEEEEEERPLTQIGWTLNFGRVYSFYHRAR
mmetsp:Transcript_23615/g.19485  ORF Transcript_23615/g.19485 Transcript_23615/m.19485 type:complete len:92 (-) Transcript_23615:67-342(-)